MSDFTKLAEQYITTWNETDPSARRAHGLFVTHKDQLNADLPAFAQS